MVFFLDNNEHVRLKAYDATIKGKTATLRITVEITDTYELSHLLRSLENLKAALPARKHQPSESDRQRSSTTDGSRRKLERQALLALPPPRHDNTEDA